MATTPNFVKLRGGVDPVIARLQDNIDATLTPVATALINTPIMGAPSPAWIQPSVSATWAANAAGPQAAFNKDALGYVHAKGALTNSTGSGTSVVMFTLPQGYRPAAQHVFVNYLSSGFAGFVAVLATGDVLPQVAIGSGVTVWLELNFLAEQ